MTARHLLQLNRNERIELDIAAYLNRIDYRGALEPTAETLRALHLAHMLTALLENLDYHLGRWMTLDNAGKWKDLYRFTLEPYQYADFAEMCHFQQTSPQSPYTQRRVCTIATPDGRITLFDMRLTITDQGRRIERLLESEDEYRAALYQYFGVDLGELKFNK